MMTRNALGLTLLMTCATFASAQEQEEGPASQDLGATTENFSQSDGEDLYMTACSGCHGPGGGGAYGAAQYPALAGNPRLGTIRYPVNLVIEGNGAMPPFADWMSDEQIASVVTYIRTHFGNDHSEPVTAEAVARMREEFADLDEG